METLLPYLERFGFPVFAFMLMYRLNQTTIKDNTTAIKDLTEWLKSNGKK